jgi:hypothetical protein
MEMWFNITGADYTEFCGNSDTKVRTAIAKASFLQKDKFCSSKAQLLCDLAYQALEYCASSQLNYPSTATLLVLISNELNGLSQPNGKSGNLSAVERYKEGVRFRLDSSSFLFITLFSSISSQLDLSRITHGDVAPADSKKLMQFFADRVLKVRQLYSYVLHQLPEEVEEEIHLEVSSPTLPLALAEGVASESTE